MKFTADLEITFRKTMEIEVSGVDDPDEAREQAQDEASDELEQCRDSISGWGSCEDSVHVRLMD